MIRYLKTRFRAFVDTCIGEYMLHYREEIADMASRMVRPDLEPVVDEVLDRVKTGHTIDYEQLANTVDMEELKSQFDMTDLAHELDYSDIANEVELSSLADHFAVSDIAEEINLSSLAEEFDEDSIADRVLESLDYKALATALLREVQPVQVRPSA